MMKDPVLLLGSDDETLREGVLALVPDAEIVGPNDSARAHVIYGGLDPTQIGGATGLRWLQLVSAGVDNWPLRDLAARGVMVTTTSGIHAAPIVEQMFGMLLMRTRALGIALREQPKRQWDGFDFGPHVSTISGKTLGILGVGAIGEHAARVGRAFGMRVLGLRRSGEAVEGIEKMFAPDARHEFFANCDVVMNTLPLTDETRGFVGPTEFAALPAGAVVINTGRGATIDTAALMDWVRGDAACAALLDVTDPEPLPPEHPLWRLPNVFITPHYGGAHPAYGERANAIFLKNLERFVRGEPLHNLVNAEAGY